MSKTSGKFRLQIDKIYRAAEKAETALPDLVDDLIERLQDDEDKKTPLRERVAAVKAIADIANYKPRMDDDLGLRDKSGGGSDSPVLLVLGNQGISLEQFRSLTPEKRQELFLSSLNGGTTEDQKTVEAEVSDAE